MAPHSSKVTLRAKWNRGWALVHAGKTTEAYDLLSGIKVSDLRRVGNPEQPDQIVARVQSIIERQADAEAQEDGSIMEALVRASKGGDREASDLLVFGYLEELGGMSPVFFRPR
jgi:hypothetical protein